MTVIEIPRAMLHRVHRRDEALATPQHVRPTLQRGIKRLKSHPGASTSPHEAALASVHDVWAPRW